jgi:hypothetical protein
VKMKIHELTYEHVCNCSTHGKQMRIEAEVDPETNTYVWHSPKCGERQGIELALVRWRILVVVEDRKINHEYA